MSTGSFASAQQRIQQRQESRRREAQAAHQAQVACARSAASPLSRLPQPIARPLGSFWTILRSDAGTRPIVRVGQVDAELLDEELLSLLKSQTTDALKYFNAHFQDDYSHEILLALRAILFKLSIWDNNASYGASLQGLQYTDARQKLKTGLLATPTRLQKSLYALITVVGRYAWDKYEDHLLEAESSYQGPSQALRRLAAITSRLSSIHSLASFVSFLIFLVNGRYRTLTDRILRLRLVSPNAQTHREVSFEYLNRQLVWHAFTEFLLFLLPLVGISRWRRWVSRAWKNTKRALTTDPHDQVEAVEKSGPLSFLPERTCAICYSDQNPATTSEAEVLGANTGAGGGIIGSVQTDIVNPYETTNCKCIYCFVCLAGKLEAEEGNGWSCLRCGEIVYQCRPWKGDVLVIEHHNHTKKKNQKSVGFVNVDDDDGGGGGDDDDDDDNDKNKDDEDNDGNRLIDVSETERLESDLGTSQWEDVQTLHHSDPF